MARIRLGRYFLDDARNPIPFEGRGWGRWMETERDSRFVAQTEIGDHLVSTVFLGLDHQDGEGPPLLFETAVWDGVSWEVGRRYSTWDEAEAGHARAVALVREDLRRMTAETREERQPERSAETQDEETPGETAG